jgi:hypothetical protein
MIMSARHDLGAPGIEYVRWSLSTSPTTLASLLLQQLPLDGGQAFTFRPEQVGPSRLADFHDGVFGQVGATQVHMWANEFMLRYLHGAGRRYLVMENVNAQSTDAWLVGTTAQYVTHQQEVYHFLGGDHPTAEAAAQTVTFALGYVTNGVLTAGAALPALHTQQSLAAAQLQAVADGTDYIVSEAYDEEGYVIWARA